MAVVLNMTVHLPEVLLVAPACEELAPTLTRPCSNSLTGSLATIHFQAHT